MATRRMILNLLITCTAVLAVPLTAWPQAGSDADSLEVINYRLSPAALAKYAAATRALAPLTTANPPGCSDGESDSLSDMAARLDAIPGVPAALAKTGLGSREYIVFGLAAFQAGMGAWALTEGQGQLPPGVSPENVAFYQAHETEFQQLTELMPESDCEDNGIYDEESGEWDDLDGWEDGDGDGYEG